MTQEEKAKAYDEALERAKGVIEQNPLMEYLKKGIEYILPELKESKESEDEKVRKVLVELISTYLRGNENGKIHGVYAKDILAWLEAKGEQKKVFKSDEMTTLEDKLSSLVVDAVHIYCKENELDTPHCVGLILGDRLAKEWSKEILESAKKELEEIESKSADKVEPKFKVSDWVVNQHGYIRQIIDIKDDCYYCIRTESSDSIENPWHGTVSYVDEQWHKWSIKDAKDGDVLYLQKDGKEHIIIYKGVLKDRFRTFVSAYCAYNGIVDAFCFADVSRYVDIAYRGIMPATKEQRDFLFRKMHKAGYEWDTEKKELKKIEQNHAE